MSAATANWIAAVRARESRRPDRLFDDPYAEDLAGAAGVAMMRRSEQVTGAENTFIPVRVRWFDDAVRASVAAGIDQVVLLGAGLDTRPYRLSLPPDLDWYEVDRAGAFDDKEQQLAGQTPWCRRHLVVADVAEDWTAPLMSAGFDPDRITLWLAEGLFFYLTGDWIVAALRTAAAICPPGSRFLADVVGATGLNTPSMGPYRDWCASQGLPPPFGMDDPTELFAATGWRLDRLTVPGGPDANYGRLPARPAGLVPGSTHLITARR